METFIHSLYVIVDVLGIVGAVLVVVPFFREQNVQETLAIIRRDPPIRGLEKAEKEAEKLLVTELTRFKPGDGAYVKWGVIVIAFSYILHIAAELLEFNSKP